MLSSRKGIGAVVAMSLLILAAVISAVYFNLFSIEITENILEGNSDVEDILGQELLIDRLYGNSLYVNSEYDTEIQIQAVELDGVGCKVNGSYTKGVSQLVLNESCVTPAGDFPNVKIVTDRGVFAKTLFFSNVTVAIAAGSGGSGSSNLSNWTSNSEICNAFGAYFPFNETARPLAVDNFNDNSYNATLWTENYDPFNRLSESGGEILFDSSGGGSDEAASVNASGLAITGPFDAYYDWRIVAQANPSSNFHHYYLLFDGSGGANEIRSGGARTSAGVSSYRIADESSSTIDDFPNSNTSGKVRMLRNGSSSTVTFELSGPYANLWLWEGSAQGYIHSDVMSGTYYPQFQFRGRAGGNWDVAVDNFVIWDDSYSATDFSGNSLQTTVHAWSTPNGRFGSGYRFDGLGSYVRVNHSTELETTTGTVAMWFNPNATQVSNNSVALLTKDALNFGNGGHFFLSIVNFNDSANRDVSFRFQKSSSSEILKSSNFSLGEWTHVAITWDGSNVRLYLNGYEQNSTASNWNWSQNQNPIAIGAGTSVSGDNSFFPLANYFNGSIDDVGIWNTTLTASQIADIYSNAISGLDNACGLSGSSGGNATPWTSNSNICLALNSYYPMNQTVRPHLEDNFDDNSYNASKWTEESDASSNMAETGGELYFDSSGGGSDESSWLNGSSSPISGNWDMYAKWRVITQNNPTTGYHLAFLTMDSSGGANEIRYGRIRLAAGNQRYAIFDESYSSINQFTQAHTEGWVRSVRTNTTNTSFLQWDPSTSTWEWQGSWDGHSHGDSMVGTHWPTIQFHMEANGEWDFAFDDFVLWNDSYIATDFSSNSNNALTHAWSSPSGKYGGSYNFDGIGTKMIVNHSADYVESNSGTVAAWFYANSSIYPRYIFSKDSSGFDSGGHFGIFIDDATGPDMLTARFQDTADTYTLQSTNFTMNTWQHVAMTWDTANVRLYINGYEQNSTASNWNSTPNLNPITIGTGQSNSLDDIWWNAQYYFNGSLDDVAIWNTSLTAAEIASIYNSATEDISALCRS